MRTWRGSVVLLAAITSPLGAAPPTVASITPRGVERGKSVEITIAGANLSANPRLVAGFALQQKVLPQAKPDAAQVRLAVTVDADTPCGLYPVRLLTDEGISGLVFFSVDAFPGAVEVEDNNTFAKPQKVPFPVVISGQCAGGDVDHYQFTVKKGQRVVVETEAARLGSGVLPQIRVLDARQRLLTSDDSQKLRGDCRASFVAPEDGDYIVEFSDTRYRAGNPPQYRLKIGDFDFVDEVFPLGGRRGDTVNFTLFGGNRGGEVPVPVSLTRAADWPERDRLLPLPPIFKPGMAAPRVAVGDHPELVLVKGPSADKPLDVKPPLTINGRFATRNERHRFQFPVQPRQKWRFAVEAEALGSHLDGVLRLTDAVGKQLALVDDVDVPAVPGQQPSKSADPALEYTVPDGLKMLTVEVRDGLYRSGINLGYRLHIEPATADFTLQQTSTELNLPRGGAAIVNVGVTRRGYTGPIQLRASDRMSGLETQGGYIPAGANAGILLFRAGADLTTPLIYTSLEGRGVGVEKDLPSARADLRLVMSRDNVAASTVRIAQLAIALTPPDPLTLQAPSAVELVHGYPASIPVTVTWDAKQKAAAVEVTALGAAPPAAAKLAPATVAVKPATLPSAAEQKGILTLTAPVNAPEGRRPDLILQTKTKIDNKDVLITAGLLQVTVKKPFTVELLTPKIAAKAGDPLTLRGRIQREPVFREPIQLKLDGLPKGIALEYLPKPLAPDQNEFQLELKSDVKSPTTAAKLTLTCSATIGGMLYNHPALTIPIEVTSPK